MTIHLLTGQGVHFHLHVVRRISYRKLTVRIRSIDFSGRINLTDAQSVIGCVTVTLVCLLYTSDAADEL